MALEPYEEEVLFQMYDHRIIGNDYKPIQKIADIIKWNDITTKYQVKKKFQHVLRHLISKGYVEHRGKRGKVGSLSSQGVAYVLGKINKYNTSKSSR